MTEYKLNIGGAEYVIRKGLETGDTVAHTLPGRANVSRAGSVGEAVMIPQGGTRNRVARSWKPWSNLVRRMT